MSNHESSPLSVIILAAGQGTRMRSRLPKVLHPLAGKPLLAHVLDTARQLQPAQIVVVYGHGGEQVPKALAADDVVWVEQAEQLGTGHAVEQAMPRVPDDHTVLILYGDVPLIQADTLRELVARGAAGFGLLTVNLESPQGYGRIVRDAQGEVQRIMEEKDAGPDEQAIDEVNSGILAAPAVRLRYWLTQLENDNAQQEFYLTDTIALAVAEGIRIQTAQPTTPAEVAGVNSRQQLAQLERTYQRRQAERLMAGGVTLLDPARLDVRGEVETGRDVMLDVNVVLQGRVRIGDNVSIGPGCVIRDSEIGNDVIIHAHSVIEQSRIDPGAQVGPFARLRPGTVLAAQTRVGNFVEIKNSRIGAGSKINHLSYIGDTDMGEQVNIGAGTITCNYDGANKHRTRIGDRAFIGSDSQLIAPVTVGDDATLGAGTTLSADAPAGELTLSRSKQKTLKGWKRPTKQERGTRDE
jgi:bifunctional UDP-N-acetylglucosamine pyrophosphorylase/glucosamine-1-phosphate N-acetyltransferase